MIEKWSTGLSIINCDVTALVKYSHHLMLFQVGKPSRTSKSSLVPMWSSRETRLPTPTPTCASSPSEAPLRNWKRPAS